MYFLGLNLSLKVVVSNQYGVLKTDFNSRLKLLSIGLNHLSSNVLGKASSCLKETIKSKLTLYKLRSNALVDFVIEEAFKYKKIHEFNVFINTNKLKEVLK